jgi:hypothetical protein
MRITRRIYKPSKYFSGLSKTKKAARIREIKKFGALSFTDPKAYLGFKTNVGRKTRKSSYSVKWKSMFPDARSLEERAAVTGVPLKFIKESYNRGMAAWRTGHRPGATQQQWGYARVSSFLLCGKTHYTTDSDLVRKANTYMSGRKWFARCSV